MTAKTTPKLTRKATALIEEFDSSAQQHGWEKDQGCGTEVDRADAAYLAAKAELEAYVLKLQRSAKRPKP